ncbi:DNA polymerase III, delta subunit [Orientia tsutsugamushi str. TA763]|nr:DNA polymerase III, delta subunit [Orientia tsutsugamushi str. TA763]
MVFAALEKQLQLESLLQQLIVLQPVVTSKTIFACTKCNSCIAMENNSHPDINEIDAASRTGVEDVRTIIDDSEYKPLISKYKIFIMMKFICSLRAHLMHC